MIMINTSNVLIYLVVERKGWNRGSCQTPVPPFNADIKPTMLTFFGLDLVSMFSHCLFLLDKILPTHNTAVSTFLFYFYPAEWGLLVIKVATQICLLNTSFPPMPVILRSNMQNLHFCVSATNASCFLLTLGSATLVAGPLPTNTSKYCSQFLYSLLHYHTSTPCGRGMSGWFPAWQRRKATLALIMVCTFLPEMTCTL